MNVSRQIFLSLIFSLLSTGLLSADEGRSNGKSTFRVRNSDSRELVVEIRPGAHSILPMQIDGMNMIRFVASDAGMTSEAGKPEVPQEGFMVAIPPGSEPVLDIIESKFDILQSDPPVPAPTYSFTDEGEALEEFHPDQRFYQSHPEFYPAQTAMIGEISTLRGNQAARVTINAIQYNPLTRMMKRYSYLAVRVRFQPSLQKSGEWIPSSDADPYFQPLYDELLINHAEATAWRGTPKSSILDAESDPTGEWFRPGATYYRIPVIEDGMYRLTYTQLLANGIDLSALDNRTTALYHRGALIPLRIETADASPANWFIEFYGKRYRGAASMYDMYSDTSMYFLTWDDPSALRFTEVAALPAGTGDVNWYIDTLVQEQDLNYFFGVTQDDIQNTQAVAGEGWYWLDFVSGVSKNVSFTVDTVKRGTGSGATIRARFHGMTICASGSCTPPSRHSAQVFLNGAQVGSVEWTENSEALFSASIPDSLLRSGTNTLQVKSKAWTQADRNISKFYLDYFTITYPRPTIIRSTGRLAFSPPTNSGGIPITVTGSPAESSLVYDVSSGRRFTGLLPLDARSFYFTDSANAAREIVVSKISGLLTPLRLERVSFRNLRSNPQGADYIIITHKSFTSEAELLARHRSTSNGLKTFLVNVQEIYDEFNYGQVDPVAIRSFLKSAYYLWKRPSPVYVTLFGDASWDSKKRLTSSVKQDFVPAYGNPPSDNALVSFDSQKSYIPFMLIGRIPVETPQQASQVVAKIIGYETPSVSRWLKDYLFITGGNTASEKYTFNFWSDDLIRKYVASSPVGGRVERVYKSSDAIIDGENRQLLQQHINRGLVFVNFIGHSGGRVWGVDVGNPAQLQNTNGSLPFVSSVSCNVGFFSDPRSNVLSEDFLMADNRGAIGVWAGSTIGYGSVGRTLVDKFLSTAQRHYSRNLGVLTTVSRLNYWMINGSTTPLVISTLQLHPLIGDPFTPLAIPIRPDLEIADGDLRLLNPIPTSDSTLTLGIRVKNLGLMVGDSVHLSISETYTDQGGTTTAARTVIPSVALGDISDEDSVQVRWNVKDKPGIHTVTVTVDPRASVNEIREDNNIVSSTFYIFKNSVEILHPRPYSVLGSTPTLAVSVPSTQDNTLLAYTFELDTSFTFTSPALRRSNSITAGPVSATWTPEPLPAPATYYWRARANGLDAEGSWATSSFRLSDSGTNPTTVRWEQSSPSQFLDNTFNGTQPGPEGVTLFRYDSTTLYSRSVGSRYNQVQEFYGQIKVNDVTAFGLWWADAYSYLVGRYNPKDGAYVMKGFDFLKAGMVDSLIAFIDRTPDGQYLIFSAVLDGKQNMTEAAYQRIESLGSANIRSLARNQSWALVARKGDPASAREAYQPTGIAEITLRLGNLYRPGVGELLSSVIGPAASWNHAAWESQTSTGSIRVVILGQTRDGRLDTLITPASSSTGVDLTSIDSWNYPVLRLSARLESNDGVATPSLQRWNVEYQSPADRAISASTFSLNEDSLDANDTLRATLEIHNAGVLVAESTMISVFIQDDSTQRIDVAIDSISASSFRAVQIFLPVSLAEGDHIVNAVVSPMPGNIDLVASNNHTSRTISIRPFAGRSQQYRIYFDEVEIRDGDFVSPTPTIGIENTQNPTHENLVVRIDGKDLSREWVKGAGGSPAPTISTIVMREALNDGEHVLEVCIRAGMSVQPVKKKTFQVKATATLTDVWNYPNPFRDNTVLMFTATGADDRIDAKIKIFTVAGRLVKTIVLGREQLKLGENRIAWDGRDDEGDDVANGTYLYKVSMEISGTHLEAVQRLVRMR